jgi:hypothetical protein
MAMPKDSATTMAARGSVPRICPRLPMRTQRLDRCPATPELATRIISTRRVIADAVPRRRPNSLGRAPPKLTMSVAHVPRPAGASRGSAYGWGRVFPQPRPAFRCRSRSMIATTTRVPRAIRACCPLPKWPERGSEPQNDPAGLPRRCGEEGTWMIVAPCPAP